VGSLNRWEFALRRYFTGVHVERVGHDRFRGRLRCLGLGEVQVLHLDAGPHRLLGAGYDDLAHYHLAVPVQGPLAVAQGAHRAVVEPGGLAVYDATRVHALEFDQSVELLLVRAPRHLIAVSPALMKRLGALDEGVHGNLIDLITSLLVRLDDDLVVQSPWSPERLAANLTGIITTVLIEQLSRTAPDGGAQLLMLEITAFVDEHLGDPDLSPETIAAAHFISPRYLRKLFEARGLRISDWIRQRRLEACRHDLVDPERSTEPIIAVAARWGFGDPAHFSRLFRSTYGCSPRQQRHSGADRAVPLAGA
jgi:AraC-like DNA-binding protein